VTLFGVLYTLFWFSSGVALSQVVRHCSFINQVFNFETDFTCDGEIISMTFAYINFIIWCIILWKGISVWSNRYDNNTLNIQLQNIESPIEQHTQEQVQEQIQEQVQEQIQQNIQEQVQEQVQQNIQEQVQQNIQEQVQQNTQEQDQEQNGNIENKNE
jgi:preprotein translocase subunit SecF